MENGTTVNSPVGESSFNLEEFMKLKKAEMVDGFYQEVRGRISPTMVRNFVRCIQPDGTDAGYSSIAAFEKQHGVSKLSMLMKSMLVVNVVRKMDSTVSWKLAFNYFDPHSYTGGKAGLDVEVSKAVYPTLEKAFPMLLADAVISYQMLKIKAPGVYPMPAELIESPKPQTPEFPLPSGNQEGVEP